MRAIDVMTSEVISVDENATVAAVARLLAERGISAVPVVDNITAKTFQYSADILAVSENGRAFKRVRIVVNTRTGPAGAL